jgi:hypothetical protein
VKSKYCPDAGDLIWLSTPFHKYGVESNPLAYARGSSQKNHDRQGSVAHAEYAGVFMKWCT